MARDLTWWRTLAPTLNWTVAKTMPQCPHSYIVRGKDLSRTDFMDAVRVIRRHGEPGKYYSRTGIYLRCDGVHFWTMGEPIESTTIINVADDNLWYGEQNAPRTHSGIVTVYDDLAIDYDARYDNPDCWAENAAVKEHIDGLFDGHRPKRILDIGAGTGLTLDVRIASPARYTGVDPSQGMLNELLRKHPRVNDLHATVFTADSPLTGYDLIVALFGAASYLAPDAIASIPGRLNPDGHAVLMFYGPGYAPSYYPDPCPHTAEWAAACSAGLALDGKVTTFAENYTMVTT
jgi:hypothetical protein